MSGLSDTDEIRSTTCSILLRVAREDAGCVGGVVEEVVRRVEHVVFRRLGKGGREGGGRGGGGEGEEGGGGSNQWSVISGRWSVVSGQSEVGR